MITIQKAPGERKDGYKTMCRYIEEAATSYLWLLGNTEPNGSADVKQFGEYLIDGEGGEKAWKEGRFALAEEDSGARTLFCELLVAAFIYQLQRRSGWS